ncbi:patatin-like phospholipase family protein [Sagittula salina]|uniref:Patatin-like phospholipase family protein n=1 Tax=Sagittula salina TaxID=2820268 RepID=A0A940MM46_9RHOB|nr:patatin-like phospholipase family protein [Sagittula salina]MBP0482083.1 patatin-like phospholipase family protein [Sagittula salina]
MVKRINIALQGGGAHGAFTWGVLDRILDEEDIEIAAISGTSAGALNGAALKAGLVHNGRAGARALLDQVWSAVGALDTSGVPDWLQHWFPDPGLVSKGIEYSWPYILGDAVTRMVSPYSWGPLYRNPLEKIIRGLDFDEVCAECGPEFYVCATVVRTGKIRIFSHGQIDADAIMASACLPTLYQAVERIDPETGVMEAFWDGGYTGNPALFPFFKPTLPDDVVVVNINPILRDRVPFTPPEIQNRINEISFNASLLRELRAIEFVQRLLHSGVLQEGSMKNVRVHMISDDALMNDLSVATKVVAVPSLLAQMKAAGRRAAGDFLAEHRANIGVRQTTDLRAMFD